MKRILLLLLLIPSISFAKKCVMHADKNEIALSWIAYKTPLKAGVGGKFTKLGIRNDLKGEKLSELLTGIQFDIDSSSTSTGNTDRDGKIVKFFFRKMVKGLMISGKTEKYSKKILHTKLTMNGVTKTVELKVEKLKNMITATGVIDVFDFNLYESLKGINKACYDLHEGKTWNDVKVILEIKLKESC